MNKKLIVYAIAMLLISCVDNSPVVTFSSTIKVTRYSRISSMASFGSVENISNSTIRVRCVWIANSESTQWLVRLNPGEKWMSRIDPQDGFHIYSLD